MTTLWLVVGLPGAGKTTTARRLAAEHRALRFTPDEWMLPLFGREFADEVWAAKRDLVEARLITVARQALRLGTDVVLDFGFWGREEREALGWLAARHDAVAEVVYLPVDPATQLERVRRRSAEHPDTNFTMTAADLEGWREQFEEPDAAELAGVPFRAEVDWAGWIRDRWPGALDPI